MFTKLEFGRGQQAGTFPVRLGAFSCRLNWLAFGSGLRRLTIFVLAVMLIGVIGCQPGTASKATPKPPKSDSSGSARATIFASNAFLAEVVTWLGGDRIELLFLVPPEQDPASWKPSPADLEKMQTARLLVLNGASYEPWVASVALPSSRMLRTANRFRESWIETEEIVHSHGPGGEHSHAGIASTTWIDFELARLQAEEVRARLLQLLPEQAREIGDRYTALSEQLQSLDREMKDLAKLIGSRPLIASHPVYQYWARRYGLNLRAVHWEPHVTPDAAGLMELEKLRSEFPATLFLWEAPPSAENRELLRTRGLSSVVFAPAANRDEQGSWLEEMRTNLKELRRAIE